MVVMDWKKIFTVSTQISILKQNEDVFKPELGTLEGVQAIFGHG